MLKVFIYFYLPPNGIPIVLCIGSNLGLKFGRERPIRVLSLRFTDPNLGKQIIITNLYLTVCKNTLVSISYSHPS